MWSPLVIRIDGAHAPDARGWIGIGVYSMSLLLLMMMYWDPSLRQDEFFKTMTTLVIGTGFVNGVVSWAYAATKGGGELADKNAAIVEQTATTMAGDPVPVNVVNESNEPVPTEITNGEKKK